MTYTDPGIDPGQPPEFPQPQIDEPDINPGGSPDELPPIEPGSGDQGDSRTFDQKTS